MKQDVLISILRYNYQAAQVGADIIDQPLPGWILVGAAEGNDGCIRFWGLLEDTQPTETELQQYLEQWESASLSRKVKEATAEVNRQAGEARSRVGTDIPFQDAVYLMKGDEAFAFPSDPEPTADKYRLAFGEAAGRNKPVLDIIAEYCYNAVMWPMVLAAIEQVRTGAVFGIKDATTVEEIEGILAGVVWPV